jgi:hypothetical protein
LIDHGLRFARGNAIGLLALFVALGGTGYAASGGFSNGGALKACVNGNGSLTLLKGGKKCKKGQTAVAWNQTGPAGATGTTGAPGAAGAAGAKGTDGANGVAGERATALWAAVNAEGKLINGSHVVSTGKPFGYTVKFDRDITGCAAVATPNGPVGDVIVGKARIENDEVRVFINNRSNGIGVEEDFSVAVFC